MNWLVKPPKREPVDKRPVLTGQEFLALCARQERGEVAIYAWERAGKWDQRWRVDYGEVKGQNNGYTS